jgi:Fatty acid hydroxylase superfamily
MGEATRQDSPERRGALLPAEYSAGRHMALTAVLASAIGLAAIWLATRANAVDWLLLPAFFVVANGIEWLVHKNPMHRPMPPRIMYKNHALIHHRAFLHDSMPISDTRELGLVMMPWYTMLGLFVMASPVALLAAWWRGAGAAGIFYLAAALYFLTYETLHALYHMPPAFLRRVGLGGTLFSKMQRHHRHHHRLDRMAHVNFNVTFPLMDWVLGTKEAPTEVPARGSEVGEPGAEPEPEPREASA